LPQQQLLTEDPCTEVVRQGAGRVLDVEMNCDKLSEVDILHHARAYDLGKRGNVVRSRAGSASKALSVSATIEEKPRLHRI
jgi:hypothetical protein